MAGIEGDIDEMVSKGTRPSWGEGQAAYNFKVAAEIQNPRLEPCKKALQTALEKAEGASRPAAWYKPEDFYASLPMLEKELEKLSNEKDFPAGIRDSFKRTAQTTEYYIKSGEIETEPASPLLDLYKESTYPVPPLYNLLKHFGLYSGWSQPTDEEIKLEMNTKAQKNIISRESDRLKEVVLDTLLVAQKHLDYN